MAIQLRNQTQQTEKPSALAYGVGLPVSDGGAGAISQALGQVAGATSQIAGQFAKRKEALNNQAITDATNTYQNEVNTQVSAASAAAKAEDMEAYEAAMAEMDKLQGAPLNAFAAATDKPLKIKEEDWQSKQLAADAWYTSKRGALDTSTVNSQYTAKFSRSLKEVGSASQINISEGNLGTSAMMELIGKSDLLHGGDLSVGATAPAMETLEKELTYYATNQLAAFGSSKSTYTSVSAWNKDVDIMKDMIAQSGAYGKYQGKLMKSVEALRVAEPKGVNVPLTGAASSALSIFNEKVKGNVHVADLLTNQSSEIVEEYRGKQLSSATSAQLVSVENLTRLVTNFAEPDNRAGLANWVENNPNADVNDFINEADPDGTMFANMRPTERNAMVSHIAAVMESMTSVPLENAINTESAGVRQLNKTAKLAALSSENELRFQQGTNLQNQALNVYDLDKPEEAISFIRAANEKFAPVTTSDYDNNEFVGLNNTVTFLEAAFKANPNNGRAYVAAIGVTKNMLGEQRVRNLIASHIPTENTPELNMLVSGLRNNAIFGQDRDVKFQNYILQGMNRNEWASSIVGTETADRYASWKTFRDNENSQISKVISDLGVVSQDQANFWSNYIEGYAIEKFKDNSSISPEEIDQLITAQIKSRVQIHENTYGNRSVVMMANREDGSFSGPFNSFIKRAASFGLGVSGSLAELSQIPRLGSLVRADFVQDKLTGMSEIAKQLPQDTLSGGEYVTGRLHRAVVHAMDSDILQYN
jgi:hypothetical protein